MNGRLDVGEVVLKVWEPKSPSKASTWTFSRVGVDSGSGCGMPLGHQFAFRRVNVRELACRLPRRSSVLPKLAFLSLIAAANTWEIASNSVGNEPGGCSVLPVWSGCVDSPPPPTNQQTDQPTRHQPQCTGCVRRSEGHSRHPQGRLSKGRLAKSGTSLPCELRHATGQFHEAGTGRLANERDGRREDLPRHKHH